MIRISFDTSSLIGASAMLMAYFWANQHGLGMTNDSRMYACTAYHLCSIGEWIDNYGYPYNIWPPLFPLLIAVGLPWVSTYLFWLHGLLYLSTLFFWVKMLKAIPFRHHAARQALIVLFACSTSLLMSFSFVWSEAPFFAAWMAFLYAIQQWLKGQNSAFWWLTLAGLLLVLARSSGIILVGLAGLWLSGKAWRQRQHLAKIAAYWAVCYLPIIGWWVYWWFVQREVRVFSAYQLRTFWQFVQDLGDLFLRWWLPDALPLWVQIGWATAACMLLMLPYLIQLKTSRIFISLESFPQFLSWVSLGYLAALLWMAPGEGSDTERYVLPLQPFGLLVLGKGMDAALAAKQRMLQWAVWAIIAVTILYNGLRMTKNVLFWENLRGKFGSDTIIRWQKANEEN